MGGEGYLRGRDPGLAAESSRGKGQGHGGSSGEWGKNGKATSQSNAYF